jgi:hypothetical protein
MSTIEMQSSNWSASVLISDGPRPDSLYHVIVRTRGETKDDALAGAQFVLDAFANGRTSYIRVNPEAHSEINFDTKEICHGGFARFSFKIETGEWRSVVNESALVGFGSLQCKEPV